MKKFLNHAVAAIAAGCFLMPAVRCVEDEKYYFLDASVQGKPEKMSLKIFVNYAKKRENMILEYVK